jgi:hypothetical protein
VFPVVIPACASRHLPSGRLRKEAKLKACVLVRDAVRQLTFFEQAIAINCPKSAGISQPEIPKRRGAVGISAMLAYKKHATRGSEVDRLTFFFVFPGYCFIFIFYFFPGDLGSWSSTNQPASTVHEV